MNCLDTYALWEIMLDNPRYHRIMNQPFVLTIWTLVEFYKTLLRQFDQPTAARWFNTFLPHAFDVLFLPKA